MKFNCRYYISSYQTILIAESTGMKKTTIKFNIINVKVKLCLDVCCLL